MARPKGTRDLAGRVTDETSQLYFTIEEMAARFMRHGGLPWELALEAARYVRHGGSEDVLYRCLAHTIPGFDHVRTMEEWITLTPPRARHEHSAVDGVDTPRPRSAP